MEAPLLRKLVSAFVVLLAIKTDNNRYKRNNSLFRMKFLNRPLSGICLFDLKIRDINPD
jgi:hypothetical protein